MRFFFQSIVNAFREFRSFLAFCTPWSWVLKEKTAVKNLYKKNKQKQLTINDLGFSQLCGGMVL